MPCLLRVDGSKQPQVSALPERRVKKQKQTASTGYFKELARAPFFCTKKPSPSGNFEKPCFRKHSLGKKPCFTVSVKNNYVCAKAISCDKLTS